MLEQSPTSISQNKITELKFKNWRNFEEKCDLRFVVIVINIFILNGYLSIFTSYDFK